MLQKLRDKTSGWIVTVILGLLMIPFLFVIDSSYLGGVGAQNVAKVAAPPTWWRSAPSWWPMSFLWQHHEISSQDFRVRFEQARQQARQQQGEAFDPRQFESTENKLAVLDQMVDEQVVRLAGEQSGIVIGDNAVREYIAAIPAFLGPDGKFNDNQYRLTLAGGNPPRTPTQFEALVRESIQQSVIPSALQSSGFTTQAETERLLKLLGETRDVELAELPELPADTAAVTDAQIKQWYDAHTKDFRQPETVSLEYVEINGANLPAATPADEATLRKRYEDEKARFAAPEQRLASHILIAADGSDPAKLKAAETKAAGIAAEAKKPGADFAALAKANSEDPGSKDAGGDLGWVERGAMVKPFEDALFAMKAGEVTGPVKTDFGYHVLLLRELKGGEGRPFEAVRDQLAAEQLKADNERVFADLSGRLVDLVNKNPTSLEGPAKELGLPVQTAGPFTRATASGIAANPAVQRAAFSDVLTQDGTVSDPIEITPNHSVMIRVTEHSPEQALPLDKAREQVIAAVRADRTRLASEKAADALLAKLKAGQTLQALAVGEKLRVSPLPGLPRTQPVPTPEINRAVFSAPLPAEGKPSYGKVVVQGRYLVYAVTKVTPANLAEVQPEQQKAFRDQLDQIDGMAAAKAYIDAMRKHYKVQTEEANL
ncbi:peptidyl-prolyl cis-trans isomerase [Stenotrophomonas rhizophila]|uniref:peptidyl-prolyl cis-trans isomerase n=1 Tax=Stenotrophomonas rhizophila TaxID=216778 RepID=UPI001E2A9D30|nr:peptidyl-prolyl cis-trans isomerase [Stenotrophomonas rhizophila]MCC7635067.1 peptidyl-prolyl cis-trans isomerase [Stenotrophomonas rhizophila]MCC7665456.1 peptidyl-prolyl cis-trans isomerase [Stenotrophomonas rhizophila]